MGQRKGTDAEDRAAEFLLEAGYTLVTRRYRARHGEIDLLALDGDVLVAVEVKSTQSPNVLPEAAIGSEKKQRMSKAIASYLSRHGDESRLVRYDTISVTPSGIRHTPDAWRLGAD